MSGEKICRLGFETGLRGDGAPGPAGEMQRAGGIQQGVPLCGPEGGSARRERCFGINQRDSERAVTELSWGVVHGHIGIGKTPSIPIVFEDVTNADHAKGGAFCRAQRAHAGGTENGDA